MKVLVKIEDEDEDEDEEDCKKKEDGYTRHNLERRDEQHRYERSRGHGWLVARFTSAALCSRGSRALLPDAASGTLAEAQARRPARLALPSLCAGRRRLSFRRRIAAALGVPLSRGMGHGHFR